MDVLALVTKFSVVSKSKILFRLDIFFQWKLKEQPFKEAVALTLTDVCLELKKKSEVMDTDRYACAFKGCFSKG